MVASTPWTRLHCCKKNGRKYFHLKKIISRRAEKTGYTDWYRIAILSTSESRKIIRGYNLNSTNYHDIQKQGPLTDRIGRRRHGCQPLQRPVWRGDPERHPFIVCACDHRTAGRRWDHPARSRPAGRVAVHGGREDGCLTDRWETGSAEGGL